MTNYVNIVEEIIYYLKMN